MASDDGFRLTKEGVASDGTPEGAPRLWPALLFPDDPCPPGNDGCRDTTAAKGQKGKL